MPAPRPPAVIAAELRASVDSALIYTPLLPNDVTRAILLLVEAVESLAAAAETPPAG